MAWPVTRLEVRTLVRNILGDTSSDVTQQDYADGVLNTEIDRAYRRLQSDLVDTQGANEITINLVAGQVVYAFPLAGSMQIVEVRLSPNATTNVVGSTVDRTLRLVTRAEGRIVMNNGEYALASPWVGLPYYAWPEVPVQADATKEPDSRVGIWPVPDATVVAGWKLTARHVAIMPTLGGDTAVLQTPPGSDVVVANRVAGWLASWRGDAQLAMRCKADLDEAMGGVLAANAGALAQPDERPLDAYGIL